jgi:hypothetical protein
VLGERQEVARRLRVAAKPAEDGLDRTSAFSEHVIVEPLSELERRTGVVRPSPEAQCPREATVDGRLKRWARSRLAQGVLEEFGRAIEALQLGEKDERLSAPRPDLRLGQQVGREHAGARPLAGCLMGASRSQHPMAAPLAVLRRRQLDGVLGELGCDGRCTAIQGQPRGLIEHHSGVGVWNALRKREVTGPKNGVLDDSRDPFVQSGPPLAEVLVEDRGQQRVSEADHPVLEFDHVRGEGCVERACRDARPLQH